jgi:hypothetical protein
LDLVEEEGKEGGGRRRREEGRGKWERKEEGGKRKGGKVEEEGEEKPLVKGEATTRTMLPSSWTSWKRKVRRSDGEDDAPSSRTSWRRKVRKRRVLWREREGRGRRREEEEIVTVGEGGSDDEDDATFQLPVEEEGREGQERPGRKEKEEGEGGADSNNSRIFLRRDGHPQISRRSQARGQIFQREPLHPQGLQEKG